MVNSFDPGMAEQDPVMIDRLWHTIFGLYIWEFLTTFRYEWDVVRGRLPYRWTIWLYSLARVTALSCVILGFVLMDGTGPINCEAAFSSVFIFAFMTMSASSLLIVLRIIAIWNRNKVAVAIAIGVWVINAAFFILVFAVELRAFNWAFALTCAPENAGPDDAALNFVTVVMLATDIILLLLMLVGLFRMHRHVGGKFGLAQVLWRQGVTWFIIATTAEVPLVVLFVLNFDARFDIMFLPPAWIATTIAATRMHRSLVEYATKSTDIAQDNLQNYGLQVPPQTKQINGASIPRDRMEFAVQIISSEQYGTPQAVRDDDLCISTNAEQMHRKSKSLGQRDEDVAHSV